MDWIDGIGELFTECIPCRGNGCELCGGHGVILSEAGRRAQKLGDDMYAELPPVSQSEVQRSIAKIKAREAGIRVATVDGEHVPDIHRKPRR